MQYELTQFLIDQPFSFEYCTNFAVVGIEFFFFPDDMKFPITVPEEGI